MALKKQLMDDGRSMTDSPLQLTWEVMTSMHVQHSRWSRQVRFKTRKWD